AGARYLYRQTTRGRLTGCLRVPSLPGMTEPENSNPVTPLHNADMSACIIAQISVSLELQPEG
ncbi:MAG: hypothetical protein ACRESK_01095, partial [Gammaproteobacteria bacterium]